MEGKKEKEQIQIATSLQQVYPHLKGNPQQGRIILKRKEISPEYSNWRKLPRMDLIGPLTGFPLRTMHTFVAEIPPGKRSPLHRHICEAIVMILAGKGYTMIDDKRYDWEEGDLLCIPVFSWHQHVNENEETARYMGIVNQPLMEALGIWREEKMSDPNDQEGGQK